jgi:hypothetical protein
MRFFGLLVSILFVGSVSYAASAAPNEDYIYPHCVSTLAVYGTDLDLVNECGTSYSLNIVVCIPSACSSLGGLQPGKHSYSGFSVQQVNEAGGIHYFACRELGAGANLVDYYPEKSDGKTDPTYYDNAYRCLQQ